MYDDTRVECVFVDGFASWVWLGIITLVFIIFYTHAVSLLLWFFQRTNSGKERSRLGSEFGVQSYKEKERELC